MKIVDKGITNPRGFYAAGIKAGIKKDQLDMGVIYTEVPAKVAGTFTTNIVKAAPVIWDKNIVDKNILSQVIVINSGIANASVGKEGMVDCEETALEVERVFNVKKDSVLLASTGVIGYRLPMDKIRNGISLLKGDLNNSNYSDENISNAILTTDTKSKEISVELELDDKKINISGICKGSGMIHPNMCTMLSFITTDINISGNLLQKALSEVVDDTFNMISVDGDTSTNDTVLLLANGLAENDEIIEEDENYTAFKEALYFISEYLAKKIAEDGEGATKLFEVKVVGASSNKQARALAKSVITSNLTKTALFGNDANWGRILCAMGYAGEKFNPDKVDLKFVSVAGELVIVKNGIATNYSEELATKILSQKEVQAYIDINEGDITATAWGCDLTYEYIKINGDYRS